MTNDVEPSEPSPTYRYRTITIHPPDDNGAREVWGEYEERHGGRVFETDGIIGWLYLVPDHTPVHNGTLTWVWMNEAGHPLCVFPEQNKCLYPWLARLAPTVTWAKEART